MRDATIREDVRAVSDHIFHEPDSLLRVLASRPFAPVTGSLERTGAIALLDFVRVMAVVLCW
jgi:hypothetical protein